MNEQHDDDFGLKQVYLLFLSFLLSLEVCDYDVVLFPLSCPADPISDTFVLILFVPGRVACRAINCQQAVTFIMYKCSNDSFSDSESLDNVSLGMLVFTRTSAAKSNCHARRLLVSRPAGNDVDSVWLCSLCFWLFLAFEIFTCVSTLLTVTTCSRYVRGCLIHERDWSNCEEVFKYEWMRLARRQLAGHAYSKHVLVKTLGPNCLVALELRVWCINQQSSNKIRGRSCFVESVTLFWWVAVADEQISSHVFS